MICKSAARLFAAICLFLGAAPAMADSSVTVPMPDLSGISEADAEKLIAALAQINVITSHCPEYETSDGEWTLLTGTGDMLSNMLGIDPSAYDQTYFGPAFATLEDPGA